MGAWLPCKVCVKKLLIGTWVPHYILGILDLIILSCLVGGRIVANCGSGAGEGRRKVNSRTPVLVLLLLQVLRQLCWALGPLVNTQVQQELCASCSYSYSFHVYIYLHFRFCTESSLIARLSPSPEPIIEEIKDPMEDLGMVIVLNDAIIYIMKVANNQE